MVIRTLILVYSSEEKSDFIIPFYNYVITYVDIIYSANCVIIGSKKIDPQQLYKIKKIILFSVANRKK